MSPFAPQNLSGCTRYGCSFTFDMCALVRTHLTRLAGSDSRLAFPTAIPVGRRNPNRHWYKAFISRDLAMYIHIGKPRFSIILITLHGPHRVQACTRVRSAYPFGTHTPQPPAGALLARWPGEFASLGLVSGCDRSQRGCSCACRLQQHLPESMSAATRQPIDL